MKWWVHQVTMAADLVTPLGVWMALDQPGTFLFESVVGGEQTARYSVVGADPLLHYHLFRDRLTLKRGGHSLVWEGNPIDHLQSQMGEWQVPDLPATGFYGGLVGHLDWDAISLFEPCIQTTRQDPLGHLFWPGVVVVFDHATRHVQIMGWSMASQSEAESRVLRAVAAIERGVPSPPLTPSPVVTVVPELTQAAFESMVLRGQSHIRNGDVFQIVLSQAFDIPSTRSPVAVYRQLRLTNPSPYMVLLNGGDYHVVGSSPEMLCQVSQGRVVSRPIAGTRPRDVNHPEWDDERMASLMADEKERAEHVMLVDLARNDLGRVCYPVQCEEMMTIDRYSHVMHMVSRVTGQLKPGKTGWDVLKATFPAGTLSGAPKLKAIQLIHDIESVNRGWYGGVIGFMGCQGNMDWCIAIRTAVYRQGVYRVQAGAGVVADSHPTTEWMECRTKAMAVIQACGGSL